jgi:ABC-type microcin C transport system permease subunit YejE
MQGLFIELLMVILKMTAAGIAVAAGRLALDYYSSEIDQWSERTIERWPCLARIL